MSTIRIVVRSWWTLAVAAFAIALATVLPASASADYLYPGYSTGYGTGYGCTAYYGCQNTGVGAIAPANYTGYAYISPAGQPVFGYRWTGYGWQRFQLATARYYVTPYSGKWRWVMTGYGWLIVGNATVVIG